jgi:hypothetical protein
MKVSRGRLVIHAAVLILVLGAASAALAQDPNLDTSRPIVGAPASTTDGFRATLSAPTPDGAGFASQGTWIAASKFTVHTSSSAPTLTYFFGQYYTSAGSSGTVRYFAQIDLEPGSSLSGATCFYQDSSATHDFSFNVQRFRKNYSTSPPTEDSGTILASGSSTGTPGAAFTAISVSPAEIIVPAAFPILNLYYLAADVAGDTSFAGCLVFWKRTISPSPGVATFSDVPLSDYRNKFVEALYSAGITVGCGGSPPNFCPDAPLTRGQMAVFLAAGLGLSWPY